MAWARKFAENVPNEDLEKEDGQTEKFLQEKLECLRLCGGELSFPGVLQQLSQ